MISLFRSAINFFQNHLLSMSYNPYEAIESFLLKRARHLTISNNSEGLKSSLNSFIQLYNENLKNYTISSKRRINKSIQLLSNIVYIHLKLKDYENAKDWLREWLKLEPKNKEAFEIFHNCLHKTLGDEKYKLLLEYTYEVKHNQAVRTGDNFKANDEGNTSKSSYFTMKNFLLLGLALLTFNYLRK